MPGPARLNQQFYLLHQPSKFSQLPGQGEQTDNNNKGRHPLPYPPCNAHPDWLIDYLITYDLALICKIRLDLVNPHITHVTFQAASGPASSTDPCCTMRNDNSVIKSWTRAALAAMSAASTNMARRGRKASSEIRMLVYALGSL